ncbi:hypothetical protein [Botrimarina hoheduenensis]|uniref:Uncharacterized protein n=1 Tax=Botrimarina hoheduenensis TaxID=2528000 RepID=A0A5C5VSG3_9BACT|nr:hypothetical protein [Botrimarina hoheduenensis]TWT41586.1 hypothetical protein Pla111_29630 [Botrimarina hoheduenensis]
MTRSHSPRRHASLWFSFALAAVALVPSTGCLHLLLATGIYVMQGGNLVPPECDALEEKRVVVLCRPPASHEFRQAGAARQLADRVSGLLQDNVPGIDVVSQRKVDEWIDENDPGEFEELGRAVNADLVLLIELSHFELFNGQTMYQGNTDVTLTVVDVKDKGRRVWDKPMGEVLFPIHSGIAVQDKSAQQFQRDFVAVVANEISRNFHKHDPHANFAIDALANK